MQNTDGIATLNPFRYRGYYFDEETGLYYLQTRYYDPELGRFISADSIEYLDPETLGGLNLYAYCENNPVMGVDPEGTWNWGHFWKILAAVVIVVAVTALTVVTAGAAAAALGVSATAVMVTTAVCGVVGGVAEIVGQCVNNGIDNLNLWDVAVETFTNAAYGAASAIGAGAASWGIRIGARAVKVGLAGFNTFIHGAIHVGENGSTWGSVVSDTIISMGKTSVFQMFGIGMDIGRGLVITGSMAPYDVVSHLTSTFGTTLPIAITVGKSILRHYKDTVISVGEKIWEFLKKLSQVWWNPLMR